MNANGRRQRQARQGFTHLGPLVRPKYRHRSIESQIAHEQRVRETARRIAATSKKSKKSKK